MYRETGLMVWETKDIIVVVASIGGAMVTVVVPVINHFLSRWRYGREKVWDLQREVYNEVLFEILCAKMEMDKFISFSKQFGQEEMKHYYAHSLEAFGRASSAQRKNYVVCSDVFHQRMERLQSEYHERTKPDDEEYSWQTIDFHRIAGILNQAHSDLLIVARSELRIK